MSKNNLYEQDFIAWVKQQVELLRTQAFDQLDLENLTEEVECLIHTYQDFVEHHAYRLWYYLLTEKYEGFPDDTIKDWHSSKAGYHHSMLESFLESPQLRQYFEKEYSEIYERVTFNWCSDRGDWDKTRLPKNPPIPIDDFLKDGNLYWLIQARLEA
jgi:hypothetical protein